jgi:hypothetical protein
LAWAERGRPQSAYAAARLRRDRLRPRSSHRGLSAGLWAAFANLVPTHQERAGGTPPYEISKMCFDVRSRRSHPQRRE